MAKVEADNWKGIPHFRIRSDAVNSPAWRVLGHSSKALYTDLRAKLRIGNNGNVSAAMSDMKHYGWVSKTTLSKALFELMALGFIVRTRAGGVARGSKVCSLYGFTDLDIERNDKLAIVGRKASFEYRNFKHLSDAEFALKTGVEKLHAEGVQKQKPKAQQKKIDGPDSGLVNGISGPDSGLVVDFPSPENGLDKRLPNAA